MEKEELPNKEDPSLKEENLELSEDKQIPEETEKKEEEKQQSYSFVNIVFNYFNDLSGDGVESPENSEKIERLRVKQEKLKTDQIEHMKFMNQMFAGLINAEEKNQRETAN